AWEAVAVHGKFPGRFRLTLAADGTFAWAGAVPVEGRDFPVRVAYPAAYPALPPGLETGLALPANCPHVLRRHDGRTQLGRLAPAGRHARRRWDPGRHTAATALRAAQRWGLALLVWQALGVWPVADAFDVPL